MDALRILLLLFVVISTSEYSETVKPTCKDYKESIRLLEGEAFYFVPYFFDNRELPNDTFTWYKNKVENISSDETNRIHHHGVELFLLNLTTEDSGLYAAWHIDQSGQCINYAVEVEVFKTSFKNNNKLLYGEIKNSDRNKRIPCPLSVKKLCMKFNGNITWSKNFTLLQGKNEDNIWVMKFTNNDEGIYTCICTWKHNNKVYKSTASRWARMSVGISHHEIQILAPNIAEQMADEGYSIKLNCSVFCGINTKYDCEASWDVDETHGYNKTTELDIAEPSKQTTSTQILTIEKVSAKDFETTFTCTGIGFNKKLSAILRLKRRESMVHLLFRLLCVLLFCIFVATLVKFFAIDLALFFRRYFPVSSHNEDVKMYDAYVVYQSQIKDKAIEYTLCQFVANILPSVLEEKCGYRLFIHGRDDIPGEDCMEQVEDRMKQSKRLLVILTLDSASENETPDECPASLTNSVIGGFDWQVGLHQVLVQGGMKVILIQLGDTGPQGYTHFPPGLQHLIRRCAPIKWPEGSRGAAAWNSRFWKKVRYLMPAIPVRKRPQSALFKT